MRVLSKVPISSYAIKFKTYLLLPKKKQFSKTEFDSIYPSDPIPPCMYSLNKANKPEKSFSMRIIILTIFTLNYEISNCLVKKVQPVLNKNETCLENSFDFISKADSWDKVQVFFLCNKPVLINSAKGSHLNLC